MDLPDRPLGWTRQRVGSHALGKLAAGLLVGLGVGTALTGDPVSLPTVGPVPAVLVGAAGLVAGASAYVAVDRRTDCGCSDGCSC